MLLYSKGEFDSFVNTYLLTHLVMPTVINFCILLLAFKARKKIPAEAVSIQNIIPVLAMEMMGWVVSIVHCIRPISLVVLFIPVCMTTLFVEKRGCINIALLSNIGIIVATIRRALIADGTQDLAEICLEGLTAIFGLLLLSLAALAVLDMTSGQKDKLVSFAKETKEAQHKAEAANRAKSAFLANMSHEIRTPINAILGMDEMILRESRENNITDYAENIFSASTSLLSLVNDVLDISKIESGKLEIEEASYDTASFVHDCCNMISERAAKKQLAFNVYCNPNLPSQLKGDEIHLRQIAVNLLSNAAKYTEKGSITFSVDRQIIDNKFSLVLSIKDTGIGIKEENLEKLFSQFTRFDMNRNRSIEGTGLGLSISKQLVDLMHGEIKVESIYGVGSVFTVIIPQQILNDTPIGNFHDHYHEITKKNVETRKVFEAPNAKILVVDDVAVNLKVAVNLLKQTKIFVDTASSGKAALEKIAQTHYDIILMDHMMPEMNGIETFSKMKEMDTPNNDTPVIMLTANAVSGVKEHYLQEGFSDYLSKPILGDKLEKMILKYLPEEKVEEIDAEQMRSDIDEQPVVYNDEPAPKSSLMLLQDFYQAYPNVDMVHGLSHYGQNIDIYISVLHSFCNKIDRGPISEAYEKKDLKRYEILMHAIKRSATDIGFVSVAQTAEALEEAAQNMDMDTITSSHALFVTECQSIIDSVKKTLDRRKG